MEELIHYTNSTPFHGHIHLMSLKFDALKAKMKLIIHVRYDDYDHLWEIKAENVIDYKNFTHCSLTPFFRIKEYSYHFLIKHNTEEQITLKLDKIPDEDPILLGKIHNFLKKETSLWMDLNNLNKRYITFPKSLIHKFRLFCDSEYLTYKIEEISTPVKSNLKLLFFGNDLTAPDNYSFRQPYILAEKFKAKRLN